MHFILSPMGSAGDVHPLLGLALALRARGHQITFLIAGYFEELVRRHELEYVEVGSREQFLTAMNHPDLWHPRRAFPHVFRSGIKPAMRLQYEALASRYRAGASVAIGSCLGFGARLAQEKLGVPLLTVHLQPAVLWSDIEPPRIPGTFGPKWLQRVIYRLGVKHFIDPVVCPSLNAFRRELGLSPIGNVPKWWHSPEGIVCLFPTWYAAPQPDWPGGVMQTDFPLWDERADEPLPADVKAFLAAGSPPVVFTPGSANMFGRQFFEAAVAACSRLGRRGLLLTRFADQVPTSLAGDVAHFEYVPLAPLLPHCAGLVHHGGIGTMSQALAAGIPQIVMPLAHDQFDNAARIHRQGLGDWLKPAQFTARRVERLLLRLLADDRVRKACQAAAGRLVHRDGLARTAAAIEAWADDRLKRKGVRGENGDRPGELDGELEGGKNAWPAPRQSLQCGGVLGASSSARSP